MVPRLWLAMFAALAAATPGLGLAQHTEPLGADKVVDGRTLYAAHCASCHGLDGKGASWTVAAHGRKPKGLGGYRSETISKKRMIGSVAHGLRDNPRMPAFGRILNARQIDAVVDYIQKTFMDGKTVDPSIFTANAVAVGKTPYPGNLVGNPTRGKLLYDLNCVSCHGRSGRGDGPRSSLIIPPPKPLTEASAKDPEEVFHIIADGRVGTAMSAWRSVFNGQQIADISDYLIMEIFTQTGEEPSDGASKLRNTPRISGNVIEKATESPEGSVMDIPPKPPSDLRRIDEGTDDPSNLETPTFQEGPARNERNR